MKESSQTNTLLLIDGNAILHRAYHALPPLTSKDGVVVNAVYGFLSMFFKIIEEVKPGYVVVCFDRPKPTFRQEMYVGYHANRPKMADDLVPQIGIVHEVLEKMKVKIFEVDGYEADDLIGTLAYQGERVKRKGESIETIIVSGDRDLLQLVNGHVKLLMPITGITNMSLFDEKAVEEKYGVHPRQFIDYKALIGDTSDNYPGVAGIGPKTASSLLQKYITFENLYQHVGELPEKIGLRLSTDAQQAAMAKKLATIVTDAPIKLELEECLITLINANAIVAKFDELGFKTLQKRIPKQILEETEKKKNPKNNEQLGLL